MYIYCTCKVGVRAQVGTVDKLFCIKKGKKRLRASTRGKG